MLLPLSVSAATVCSDAACDYVTDGLADQHEIADSFASGSTKLADQYYYLNGHLYVLENTYVHGEGKRTVLDATPTSSDLFKGAEKNVEFHDLSVDLNNANKAAFNLTNGTAGVSENVVLRRVQVLNVGGPAIRVYGQGTDIQEVQAFNVFTGIALPGHSDLGGQPVGDQGAFTRIRGAHLVSSGATGTPTEYGEGIEANQHDVADSVVFVDGSKIVDFGEDGIDANSEYSVITNSYIDMRHDETRGTHGITTGNSSYGAKSVITNNLIVDVNDQAIVAQDNNEDAIIMGNIIEGSDNPAMPTTGVVLGGNQDRDTRTVIGNSFSNLDTAIGLDNPKSFVTLIGNTYDNVSNTLKINSGANNMVKLDEEDFFLVRSGQSANLTLARTSNENGEESASIDLMENGREYVTKFGEEHSFGFRIQYNGAANRLEILSGRQDDVQTRVYIDRNTGAVQFEGDIIKKDETGGNCTKITTQDGVISGSVRSCL